MGWGNDVFPASISGIWCETPCLLNPGPLPNAFAFTELESTERFAAFLPVVSLGGLSLASWDFAGKGEEGCELAITPVSSLVQIANRDMGVLSTTCKTSSL